MKYILKLILNDLYKLKLRIRLKIKLKNILTNRIKNLIMKYILKLIINIKKLNQLENYVSNFHFRVISIAFNKYNKY